MTIEYQYVGNKDSGGLHFIFPHPDHNEGKCLSVSLVCKTITTCALTNKKIESIIGARKLKTSVFNGNGEIKFCIVYGGLRHKNNLLARNIL